jgi:NAD(P)-dependent dehydrogenase (short-subunit alcohol dehydrogenase family)
MVHKLGFNFRKQASITGASKRIRKEFGRLDVPVNNAAISNTNKRLGLSVREYANLTRPSNVSLDEVRAVWETNVFGVLAVYQAMLPLLREHKFLSGSILVV